MSGGESSIGSVLWLLAGWSVPPAVVAWFAWRLTAEQGWRPAGNAVLGAVLTMVVIPFAQVAAFEPFDDFANTRLARDLERADIATSSELSELLGTPDEVSRTERHVVWSYRPIRPYWLGSTLDVLIDPATGHILSWKANDD